MTKAQKVLAFVREQIGEPYVFGKSGMDEWDCSGLTKTAVKQIGYFFYHGATTQWNRGFESGDPTRYGYWLSSGTIDTLPVNKMCLLFNQDKQKLPKLSMAHTAIYDGNGRVIQAGGYGGSGVHENPLDRRRFTHWAILKGTDEAMDNTPRILKIIKNNPYMRGDDVFQVQKRLLELGYSVGSKQADGVYGRDTETAVKAFQIAQGIVADGKVGAGTRAALTDASPVEPTDRDALKAEALVLIARLTEIVNKC